MRDLPALLRAAERRVNANVWPNTAENAGADSHLASIPANRDTDTDLLLIEAADRIAALEGGLREVMPLLAECDCIHSDRDEPLCPCMAARALLTAVNPEANAK